MKRKTVLKTQRVKRKRKSINPLRVVGRLLSGAFKLLILFFVFAGISLFFTYSYHYLESSPLLKLKQVEIRGANTDLKKRIIGVCKLDQDVSLLTLHLNEIKQTIERDPWVRSVRVERRFPHKIIVDVEMEHPYALVLMDGLYYMNRWGEVFKQLDDTDSVDYPVITGISGPGIHIQKQLQIAAGIIETVARRGSEEGLKRISEIHISDDQHLSLYFSGFPAEVQVTVSNFTAELEKLKKIVGHLKRTGRLAMVNRINLDCRSGAVVSFERG